MAKTAKTKTPDTTYATLASAQLAVALASLPKVEDDTRDAVRAGTYDIDQLIRITGHLKVGGDTMTRQVNKLCPWALVKLLADRLPTTVVDECFDQAVVAAVKGVDLDPGDELKARTEASIDQLSPIITQVRRGSVRFIGTCTAVHG